MTYRFVQHPDDYSDLASGKVFEGAPHHPAFPIRLASEIFQRCVAIRAEQSLSSSLTLYDPCCGSAYLLSTVAYLHAEQISRVIGSDVDDDILPLANRNLSLLTVEGIERRIEQLTELWTRFGKESHREAIVSAERMKLRIETLDLMQSFTTSVFQADALKAQDYQRNLGNERIDLVITDIPYGSESAWRIPTPIDKPAVWAMLEALQSVLAPRSLVAICTNRQQKVAHEAYQRMEQFQIGKRRILILQPA